MNNSRIIKLVKDYKPLPMDIGDEIYPNGIFNFSISRICEHIALGELKSEKEQIDIKEWFKSHIRGLVNEEHLPSVDVSKAVIQVEIRPDRYEIIDGNHRIKKACHDGLEVIESFKLKGEHLLPYFADERGYKAFVEYWNLKVKEDNKSKKLNKRK